MLIKSLTGLLAGLAIVLVSGCSTPCDAPGALCAPVESNTSVYGQGGRPPAMRQPTAPASTVPPSSAPAPRPADAVVTAPIELPGTGTGAVTRIALLLPLDSPALGAPAQAVRAGFMASVERDGAGFEVEVVATGDNPQDALAAYARAAAGNDIVVGPLARPAVSALIAGGGVTKPTVALNHPDQGSAPPQRMLVAGLSIEDEARQVAQWAAREHPHSRALILTSGAAWGQRTAGAFEARWSELGNTSQRLALPAANGIVDRAAIDELKTRLEIDAPDVLFAALDVAELRQVRAVTGAAVPVYGGGSLNPGHAPGTTDLDGVHILDLPWLVRPDHPAVMVYPRPLATDQPLDMERLYALGIDAFRVARDMARRPNAPFDIDGVTGQLAVRPGAAAQSWQLQRKEAAAVYRNGRFEPVEREPVERAPLDREP